MKNLSFIFVFLIILFSNNLDLMELKAIGWNDYLTVMNKTNIEQALAMAIEMDIESESTTPSYKGNSNYEF